MSSKMKAGLVENQETFGAPRVESTVFFKILSVRKKCLNIEGV